MDSIELVKEFHEATEHAMPKEPQFPSDKDMKFRVDFMHEELNELKTAYELGNLIEFADGLGDLQYVLDGWFLNAGLYDKKEAILAEIHRSNMTKFCKTGQEANRTIHEISLSSGQPTENYYWKEVNRLFVVYRKLGNKVMKSINYSRPDLISILTK